MFTILCLLCLYGNREYPSNFQSKSVSVKLFFQVSAQVKWKGRHFWSGRKHIDLSSKLSITYASNINYYKSVYRPIPTLSVRKSVHNPIPNLSVRTGNILAIFKTNQQTLLSLEFPDIFSSCPNGRGKKDLSWKGSTRGTTFWDYLQEYLVVIRDKKVSPFVKFEIILPLLCFLLDSLTN